MASRGRLVWELALRHRPAFLWAGIALSLILFLQIPTHRFKPAPAYTPSKVERSAKHDHSDPNPSDATSAPVEQKLSKAEIYRRACNTPKDYQEADLCEQRRMADAAVSALKWTRYQTIVAGVGLLLVFGGLWASAKSARESAEQTKLSSRSLQLSQGAILDIKDVELKVSLSKNKDTFDIEAKIHNAGKTVATVERIYSKYYVGEDLPDKPTFRDASPMLQGAIFYPNDTLWLTPHPERVVKFPPEQFAKILDGELRYFIYGRVLYTDIFGNKFDAGFARQVHAEKVADGKYTFRMLHPQNVASSSKYNYFRQRTPLDLIDPSIDFGHFGLGAYSAKDGIKVDYSITNVVNNDVVLEDTTMRYWHGHSLPESPIYDLSRRPVKPTPRKLRPGQSIRIRAQPVPLPAEAYDDALKRKRTTFVYGKAIYREGGGRFEAGFAAQVVGTPVKRDDGKVVMRFQIETPPGQAAFNFIRRIPRWSWGVKKTY